MIRKNSTDDGKSVQQWIRLHVERAWPVPRQEDPGVRQQLKIRDQGSPGDGVQHRKIDLDREEQISIPGLREVESLEPPQPRVETQAFGNGVNQDVAIIVNMTYTSEGGPLEYMSWNAAAASEEAEGAPFLVDQNGRIFEMTVNTGDATRTHLESGESVSQILVFHTPDDRVTSLRLVLPGHVFGVKKMLGFEIPVVDPNRTQN